MRSPSSLFQINTDGIHILFAFYTTICMINITITSGTTITAGLACIENSGPLNISGGTFTATSYKSMYSNDGIPGYALINKGTGTVTGGKFIAASNDYAIWDLGSLNISNAAIQAAVRTGMDAVR